jgi:hypothetical protein
MLGSMRRAAAAAETPVAAGAAHVPGAFLMQWFFHYSGFFTGFMCSI